jgi:phage terminase small subunit
MGKRGPAPAPTALKLVKGTHPSRVNRKEPKPAEREVKPPSWLEGVALEVWRYYAPDLVPRRAC